MITQNVLCHLPEEKKTKQFPALPASLSKGLIPSTLILWTSASKRNAPECHCCPAGTPMHSLPTHRSEHPAVLLVTTTAGILRTKGTYALLFFLW